MSKRDGSQEPGRSLFEQRLSRAHFLRLAGAGVGLSFIPSSLAGLGQGGVASAQTTTPGVPTILGGQEYPIGLWWPPPPKQTTTKRYKEIAAAGFNFVIGGNGVNNDTYNPAALKAAGANNLRFVLTDSTLTRSIRDGATTEMRSRIQVLLNRYGGYAALAGLNLYDEPSSDLFKILASARQRLQGLDPKQLPWVNLLPYTRNSTQLGTRVSDYNGYLELYRREVNPPFISFDHYPLLSGTAITAGYFDNWAMIGGVSLQSPSIPSWGFIQSVDFTWAFAPRRRPNEDEIFWQVNVCLAYGAKGLQYFCYWTPKASDSVTFGEALVTESGKLTPLYYYAQRANDYLRVVGKVLLPLKSESVVHANEDPLPRGARAFSNDGYVTSVSGSPVILGSFSDPTGGTGRYLLVVNRSFRDPASTQLALDDVSVSKVSELDSSTGTPAEVTLNEPGHSLQLIIDPGKARLYLLQ
jgi:hypothetical protein